MVPGAAASRQKRRVRPSSRTVRMCRIAAVAVAGLLTAGTGCGRGPRRIPYIPPVLPEWSAAYRSPRGLRLHVFTTTGSLAPPRGMVGGPWGERVPVEVPAYIIEHPRGGLILVGTGLSSALAESAEEHLGWLLATLIRPTVKDGQDIARQMKAKGFDPEKVARVVLPDCRFSETGQLASFSNATVTVARKERVWAQRAGVGSGVRREDLLAVRRWNPVDFSEAEPLGTIPRAMDLLGDESVWLLALPGYTPGTMAILVRLASGPVVLAGGVAPLARTLTAPTVPMVASDPDAWWESAWRLKRFRELVKGVVVIPGFEPAVPAQPARRDVHVHDVEGHEDAPEAGEPQRRDRPRRPSFPLPDTPTTPPPFDR